jgi:predicted phosphohydrolase
MGRMLWTLSDLHLSGSQPKPMDIFGARWRNHPERIAAAWRERVSPDDAVLVAGDISWALKPKDAMVDLAWLDALPGRKVLSRGNHDYWWSSERTRRLRRDLPPSVSILEGEAPDAGEAVVCGVRGWNTPETPGYQESQDRAYYERELQRIDKALAAAQALAAGAKPIVAMIHFPPFVGRRPTEFARRICAAGAAACVYGHLHRREDWANATQGLVEGVYYQLTSCDYLGFGPVAVRGLQPT